jgi:hypothetical protein
MQDKKDKNSEEKDQGKNSGQNGSVSQKQDDNEPPSPVRAGAAPVQPAKWLPGRTRPPAKGLHPV